MFIKPRSLFIKLRRRYQSLGLLLLALVLVGCGLGQENWAGLSHAEDEGDIFVSYDRFVAKLDTNGDRTWTYPPDGDRGPQFFSRPTITDEIVFVGDYEGGVHAIDRESGESVWVHEVSGTSLFGLFNFGGSTDRIIGQITVGDGFLYVPDEEGVFQMDINTGQRNDDWLVETERAVWSQPVYVSATEDAPARLFITSLDHTLYAVEAETAEIIWQRDLGGALPGSPLYDPEQNLLFVGSFNSELMALDASDGAVIDRFETEGWVWDAPAQDGDNLYFGDLEGYLYAVSFTDQAFQQLWRTQVASEDDGKLRATPLLSEGLVIVGADNSRLYAVDQQTGESAWSRELEEKSASSLIAVEGEEGLSVITAISKNDPLLIALQLENGNDDWTYNHED